MMKRVEEGEEKFMKFSYPALFRQKTDGSYIVRFPDLEYCIAEGKNFEEALRNAKDAERAWLELELLEDMEVPPFVSDPAELACEEGEMAQMVAVNIRFMEGWDE